MLPLLWLLPLGAALAGPTPTPPRTTFRGHLDHAPAGDTVRLWVGSKQVKAPLDPGGDFKFEFKLTQNMPVEFSYANQVTKLYLMPGDQLVMHLDFKDFDKTLTYSGPGSAINNYLAQSLYKFSFGPDTGLLRVQDFPKGTPAEARQAADALRQARREYLAAYNKAHPLPAAYVREEQENIALNWGMQQLGYASANAKGPLPAEYYNFVQQLPLAVLNQRAGRSITDNSLLVNFAMGYGMRLVPSGRLSTDPAEGERIYQLATRELGAGLSRDWTMKSLLTSNIRANLPGAQAFCRTFRRYNADSTMALWYRQHAVPMQQLAPGLVAPNFTLTDNTGKQVALSDFKGKVVYLDFWGTWCRPCMQEMQDFAPALKKQFEGRDVVFLYVSVGDPEAKWQQTLDAQHFGSVNSVHLRAPDDQVAQRYLVNGYPSYYLIGRDGRLVQPWTSRPSDGAKTVAAIEAALKQ